MRPERKLGDVDVKDYLRMVGARRRWRALSALAVGVTIILSFVAGRFGPWDGRDVEKLKFEDAVALLETAPETEWQHELGVVRMFELLVTGTAHLARIAEVDSESAGSGKAKTYAILGLRNLAITSIDKLKSAGARSPDEVQRALNKIRDKLN